MTSCYSISLIRDTARGTSQLYLRVAWTSAGLVCSGILLTVCPDGWPKFQSFFDGLQSIATDDEKHYQCQNIVLNNIKKLDNYFWNSIGKFNHCLHRWEIEKWLRVLTKAWKYLTRDNSTVRECSPLRTRGSLAIPLLWFQSLGRSSKH